MSRFVFMVVCLLSASACGQSLSVSEQYLFSAVNQERASRHLQPLRMDTALQAAARLHARQMAEHGSISHRFSGEAELSARGSEAGARFDLITENVAEGPTAVMLHEAWMHSAGHRANILDAGVSAVGIAVVERDHQLYAVEDFARTVQNLTLAEQETAVGVQLDLAGIDLISSKAARQTCAMTTGYAGEEQPSFVVRFTTADLTQLPKALKERLASPARTDRLAAVGACNVSDGKTDFATYTIAVLLYR